MEMELDNLAYFLLPAGVIFVYIYSFINSPSRKLRTNKTTMLNMWDTLLTRLGAHISPGSITDSTESVSVEGRLGGLILILHSELVVEGYGKQQKTVLYSHMKVDTAGKIPYSAAFSPEPYTKKTRKAFSGTDTDSDEVEFYSEVSMGGDVHLSKGLVTDRTRPLLVSAIKKFKISVRDGEIIYRKEGLLNNLGHLEDLLETTVTLANALIDQATSANLS